ncbi:MAG TPA: response regulator transcription factor [Candidatus Dormibacteraeota bacterium]|nr:response regulator transcription factor [Candidatus Dormibacteraeota bacterium]
MSGRVLVVDDEMEIRRALRTGLGGHGFEVEAVSGGAEALAAATARKHDLVLLDLGLPDIDGFTVLTRLRERSRAPVIVLSVMADERDKVRALDLGADDYLVKPFGLDELLARIRAVLRRQASVASGDAVVRVGELAIDLGRRLVTVDGRAIHLTPTEYELLRYLAIHAGKLVTHTILLREVWGAYAVGESQNTRYVVAQIRRKLGDDPARPRFIATEPGVGYRLRVDPDPAEHPNKIHTPG